MLIDGKKIAKVIQDDLTKKINKLDSVISLHIFVVGDNPVIESFIKYKKNFAEVIGVEFVEHRYNVDVSEDYLINKIEKITKMFHESTGTFGIVIQLPLPDKMDTQKVLDTVPRALDVDGLSTSSDYIAPVAGAIREMLRYENIDIRDKDTLVIGRGKLVGEPVAKLLDSMGARVTIADKQTDKTTLSSLCKKSYMIVSGAGVPNLITMDMVSSGSVLIDAGTSTRGGSLVGDISLDCENVALYLARTPGGVGPLTIAVLFKNLIDGYWMTK